jgi:hypothetical protein
MTVTLLPKMAMMTAPNKGNKQHQIAEQRERVSLLGVAAARRGSAADRGRDRELCASSSSCCSLKVFTIRLLAFLGILSVLREVFWQERSLVALMSLSTSKLSAQDKHAESVRFVLPSSLPVLRLSDLTDLTNDTIFQKGLQEAQALAMDPNTSLETWNQAIVSREPVLHILERAGSRLSLDVVKLLPKWQDVTDLYGNEPVILGLERCVEFRRAHAKQDRHVGIAGQFNTGTNALAKYFWDNLRIPENPNSGMLANVPWHKHGWVRVYRFL